MTAPAIDRSLGGVVRVCALEELSAVEEARLLDRGTSADSEIQARTAAIIARVRGDGDRALRELAAELDGVVLDALEVPRSACEEALDSLEPELRRALDRARANIERAHRAFRPRAVEVETERGVVIGRRPDPLGRVGVYAPGGRAAYPSSVLMGAVPARVAGVGDVILCSPPQGGSGRPSPVVLAAAALAGVDRVFAIGGAGAIAAMAHGTTSVPRVDRIVGPGNAYVAEAKLQLSGYGAIDAPAGPSELLLLADDSAEPEMIARELCAQAEHDPLASAVALLVGGATFARAVAEALAEEAASQPRASIVRQALAARGAVLFTTCADRALAFAAAYAPEHLLLIMRNADELLGRLRNAGTIFVGEHASVSLGDYMTGANHVLPTGGLARSYSGLSTADFVRWTTYQRVTPSAAARMGGDAALMAAAEGLGGHRRAADDAALRGSASAERAAPGAEPRERCGFVSRATYAGLQLYAPDRAPCAIDVSDNTNGWGMPPASKRAIRAALPASLSRYPSLYANDLKCALGRYADVAPEAVVTGCGSDDVLDAAIRAFASPGDRVAYPEPSFPMVPLFARMNEMEGVAVPLGPDLDIDADALLATRARIIYICSPNNPTGTLASRAAIQRILAEAPGLVILDEAYAEFAGRGLIAAAPSHGRLLVVRTMSKAFGLAGLRVGYAVGAPELVAEVEKSRGPYKVSAAAERAAVAALGDGLPWVRRRIREAVRVRERLDAELRRMGLSPVRSHANFVLVPVPDAATLAARLRERGVAVRPFTALPLVGDALRISVAPWPILERVLSALASVLP